MYLKALEIQGFKSFPDKTAISFDRGISAVVGPNGSGKSNLSDAILWVLGEQKSRALRGGKMEDVIFGGTQTRKAVGFAQVTLVLDNADGTLPLGEREVMVSRRYYRSGESIYSINRTVVRLRDVHELFLDTGLGQEGYSIIGQGKIDEILSARQEERRGVLEEAAGISRFRYRKEEAERKLNRTEENLLRITDKISELELQVVPLQEQAERAKQYLHLRDELRGLEVSLWLTQLERLRENRRDIGCKLEAALEQREGLQQALQALYDQAETLQHTIREQDVALEQTRQAMAGWSTRQGEAESRLAVMEAKASDLLERRQGLEKEEEAQGVRINRLYDQTEEKRARLGRIEKQQAELERLCQEDGQQRLQIQKERDALCGAQDLRARQAAARKEQTEAARQRQAALQAVLDELLARETQMNQEKDAYFARETDARNAVDTSGQALKEAQGALQQATERFLAAQDQVEQQEKKTQAAVQEREALLRQLEQAAAKIQMLKELEDLYEGYSRAVRVLMKASKAIPGIRGPVSTLIQVSPPYAFAIEVALGGALQQIVVETDQVGKAAIEYLKREEAGRATFLPMNTVHGKPMDVERMAREPGFLGIASALVSNEPEYDDVIAYLLGRTVVVSDLDHAIPMARKYQYQFRIVTLDGQMLQRGGVMTGGSAGKKAGILSRAVELDQIKRQQQHLQAKLSGDRAAEQEQNALARARAQLQALEQARSQDMERVVSLQLTYEQCKAGHVALLSQGREQEMAHALLQTRIEETTNEMVSLAQALQQGDTAQSMLDETLGQADERQQALDREMEALAAQDTRRQTQLAALQSERAALEVGLEELLALFQGMEEDRQVRQTQQRELAASAQNFLQQIEEHKTSIQSFQQKQAEMQTELQTLAQERMQLEGQRVRDEKETQKTNQSLLQLERACAALAQKKQEWDLEEKGILEKLWDTYGLSHSGALPLRQKLENIAEASRRIGTLKQKMRALGAPNLGAIEEFERVNSRYEYLTRERTDITQAKEELKRIIQAITGEMKEVFRVQFDTLNQLFSQVFQALFGGGRACLELETDKDILECNIEIRAQPPGKSLKTISLLSGGEKAFVAIALYFAILKLRPTPFCIMDEIEAALDEQNVIRFAQYLRSISGQTQFIVITHRRGTMEEADILYGVTMQEQGVSKVVTLRLDEASDALQFS